MDASSSDAISKSLGRRKGSRHFAKLVAGTGTRYLRMRKISREKDFVIFRITDLLQVSELEFEILWRNIEPECTSKI